MTFQFRQFPVEDEQSTMKVGTDAVLLGAWVEAGRCREILDIGTGCGVIALMMAQKSKAALTAIDIDEASVRQAASNFRNSPWTGRMKAIHSSLQEFARYQNGKYDLIITNPPYFRNSLKSPSGRRNMARHNDHLSPGDLLSGVTRLLSGDGKLALVLPADDAAPFRSDASFLGLFPVRELVILPKPGTEPVRIAMEFAFSSPERVSSEVIVIRNADNSFTDAYRMLTKDFYLDF